MSFDIIPHEKIFTLPEFLNSYKKKRLPCGNLFQIIHTTVKFYG